MGLRARKPRFTDRDRGRGSLFLIAIVAGLATATPGAVGDALAQNQGRAQVKPPEVRRTLPLTDFYETPNPLPAGKAGELIRSQAFDEYELPPEVSTLRILYHSRSANGEDVAASGVVLIPDEPPPAGGWPIIAWAHGFTGTARRCAPSLMRNVYEGPLLSMFVKLGYAVVATDYVGLGTNFRNAFLDVQSNADDVIYSIPAARAAAPQIGRKWIATGTSEGGLTVLGVAELEAEIRDPNYLGSIAVSGIADVKDVYEQLSQAHPASMSVFLAYGVKTLYPPFQVNNVLTEKALALYHQIENACTITPTGPAVSADQIVKPNWKNNTFIEQFFRKNTFGKKPAYGPLLIISSEADPLVLTGMTAQSVARMCKQHDQVQFSKYRSPDFGEVMGDSVREQITWIQARFADRPAPSNCP